MTVLTAPARTSGRAGNYDDVASEYYDVIRHPTCANFRAASDLLLHKWLDEYPISEHWICEVGPGRSAIAALLLKRDKPLDKLALVDSSTTMLGYSSKYSRLGAHLILGNSTALPLRTASVNLIVSSLGDPYNSRGFWKEIFRLLKTGGKVFFTTPSFQWALAFRGDDDHSAITAAQFDLLNGRTVLVPSFIYSREQQCELIAREGLRLGRVDHISIRELSSQRLSPKLLVGRGADAEIVTGYVATKP